MANARSADSLWGAGWGMECFCVCVWKREGGSEKRDCDLLLDQWDVRGGGGVDLKCLSVSGGGVMIWRRASDSLQLSLAALLCLEVWGIQRTLPANVATDTVHHTHPLTQKAISVTKGSCPISRPVKSKVALALSSHGCTSASCQELDEKIGTTVIFLWQIWSYGQQPS